MGVPAFFRWLSKKYPAIVTQHERGSNVEYTFDNLYLDMNGIIHPCTHPEDRPAPETEEEMFHAIYDYIEMIMKMTRPQKLLYMAVDGVAPRAKMNQQRSRRFRASQEGVDKKNEIETIKDELRASGVDVDSFGSRPHFDSNVITPGTQFMINLSIALRGWIDDKLSTDNEDDPDNVWPKDLVVILSDASVPGEGEHKIMEYIRRQKPLPTYDPNLSHCLCGADADLIMLGLATHELNFTILREEFVPNQPKPCDICNQYGHEMAECEGKESDPLDQIAPIAPGFIFIRLNVLREYLEVESKSTGLDLERFIDDFVFLCFFVGNDFLPHLPSLEIREGAIDRLLQIYKEIMSGSKEYLSKDGIVNLKRAQLILNQLGMMEDETFKRRTANDQRFKERLRQQKRQKQIHDPNSQSVRWMKAEKIVPRGSQTGEREKETGEREKETGEKFGNARQEAYNMRMNVGPSANAEAANRLKAMLRPGNKPTPSTDSVTPSTNPVTPPTNPVTPSTSTDSVTPSTSTDSVTPSTNPVTPSTSANPVTRQMKRKEAEDSDDEPEDEVSLGEEGWKERYYFRKFDCAVHRDVSEQVVKEYVRGLSWVLLYYYQGCPDWQWFYPFHYAPFASDFKDIQKMDILFNRESEPFKPLEQLMSVFPAASSKNLPQSWQLLMKNPDSPIIDFYPATFRIDLNGKRAAWMGVALLPFIDEDRLKSALHSVYPDLDQEEKERNSLGTHLLFVSRAKSSKLNHFLTETLKSEAVNPLPVEEIDSMAGSVKKSAKYSHQAKKTFCLEYFDPVYEPSFVFPAIKLPEAREPVKVLKPEHLTGQCQSTVGFNQHFTGSYQPTIGFSQNNRKAYLDQSGHRALQHNLGGYHNNPRGGHQNNLGGYQNNIGGYQNNIGGYQNSLGGHQNNSRGGYGGSSQQVSPSSYRDHRMQQQQRQPCPPYQMPVQGSLMSPHYGQGSVTAVGHGQGSATAVSHGQGSATAVSHGQGSATAVGQYQGYRGGQGGSSHQPSYSNYGASSSSGSYNQSNWYGHGKSSYQPRQGQIPRQGQVPHQGHPGNQPAYGRPNPQQGYGNNYNNQQQDRRR